MPNNFAGDPNVKALWRFESGALTTDSCTWNSARNTLAGLGPDESQDFIEGNCAADFEKDAGDHFHITDANLCTDFPLKNGDATKTISLTVWVKPEGFPTDHCTIIRKSDETGNKRSFWLYATDNGSLMFGLGHTGGTASEIIDTTIDLVANQWQHIGFTYDDTDKFWYCKRFNDYTDLSAEGSGNATNNINVEDARLVIGCSYDDDSFQGYCWDGIMDEFVVFNDILTEPEIDQIRNKTYGAQDTLAAFTVSFLQ
jgi:hypothetical protein